MLVEADDDPRFRRGTFTWVEDDPGGPAKDVLIRLIPMADKARDNEELDDFMMDRGSEGLWSKTVRLPADFRCSYQLCIVRDEPIRGVELNDERWMEVFAMGIADPANPLTIGPCTYGNPGSASILELPDTEPQPWHEARPNIAQGKVTRIEQGTSVFHVYEPALDSPEYSLAVLFDGRVWVGINGASTLDNLVAEHAIPPTIAVMVESMYGTPREPSLTQPAVFMRFLQDDLLPFLSMSYHITQDPAKTVLAGQSLGGLAATYAGLTAPERFGRILTQSGSFWRDRKMPEDVDAKEIMTAFEHQPKTNLKFFQEAGLLEGNLLDKNRKLHGILTARGYDVTCREYSGGHDYAWWRGGLADGLIALLS